jgi:AcrR family transcriptional regulator
MPRPKTLPDEEVLQAALGLIRAGGPESLTFARLAGACGLSAATLVQRFGSKAGLKRSALLLAWDRLDQQTATLAAHAPPTSRGAIEILVGLSTDYGGVEAYAEGLLLLREDLRDPALRARGAAWKVALCAALEERFRDVPGAPRGIGLLLASQWQGALLWWSFDPQQGVRRYVERSLTRFVSSVLRQELPAAAGNPSESEGTERAPPERGGAP